MAKLLVSIREGAQMLDVSTRTIHRYCALGVLPFVRVGRRKLLRTADLLQFAQRGISVEMLPRVKERMNSNG
jgi:excisionase family DNA binding protein